MGSKEPHIIISHMNIILGIHEPPGGQGFAMAQITWPGFLAPPCWGVLGP